MLQSALFAIEVILPILFMMLLGFLLRRWKLIDVEFIKRGSEIVFKVALPALLFLIISRVDLNWQGQFNLLITSILCTLIMLLLGFITTRLKRFDRATSAIVIQAAFRANLGISGVAYVLNAYGSSGLARAAIFLGFSTVMYNLIGIILLNHAFAKPDSPSNRLQRLNQALLATLKNPMIISISLAILVSAAKLKLAVIFYTTADYIAQLSLPLAMLLIGASIRFKSFQRNFDAVFIACLGKTLIMPSLALLLGYLFNVRGIDLGIVFLMTMAPTSAASFIMVQALGGDAPMAARMVALSSLMSMLLGGIGLSILDYFKLIH